METTSGRVAIGVLAVDCESTIQKLLTTPDAGTGCMPLTQLAMGREYDILKAVLEHIMDRCAPNVVADITGAQPKGSRYDPSLDFEYPSDRSAYKPDPSWTLYHLYAAAGARVRERLEPLVEMLPTSALFRKDRHDRTPFEIAMENCDPPSAVLLLEKMGEASRQLGMYALRNEITGPLERVSDDRLLLPRLYDMTEMWLLSREQFLRMAHAFQDCVGARLYPQLNIVVNTAVEREDLGMLRAVLAEFPAAVENRVLFDDRENGCAGWEYLGARTEAELQSDREAGTMNVPLSALMLRDCMEYLTNAYLGKGDVNRAQELNVLMRDRYPLAMRTVEALLADNDTVAFYWPPDAVAERLRAERMEKHTEPEREERELPVPEI